MAPMADSYEQSRKPAALATDERFSQFVQRLRNQGASKYTIASALAHSDWPAAPGGHHWHWRQVPSLLRELGLPEQPPTPTTDGLSHTDRRARDQYAYAVAALASYDRDGVRRVNELQAAGHSGSTIASMLNRNHVQGRDGHRWCERSVLRVLGLLRMCDRRRHVPFVAGPA